MFTNRPPDQGIIFVENIEQGAQFKSSILDGDSVTLRIGDERVLVRNINRHGSGRYKGTIYGFEPSCGLEYDGLKLGEEVEFDESHVFGCSS